MDETLKRNRKAATADQMQLYCLIGEAICTIQIMEDALSYSNTFKKYSDQAEKKTREEMDILLKKHQSDTLGKAIKFAKKHSLYDGILEGKLSKFNLERNWLVHKSLPETLDGVSFEHCKSEFFKRIKDIGNEARNLHQLIEEDMMRLAESKGINTSDIRQEIDEYYRT